MRKAGEKTTAADSGEVTGSEPTVDIPKTKGKPTKSAKVIVKADSPEGVVVTKGARGIRASIHGNPITAVLR